MSWAFEIEFVIVDGLLAGEGFLECDLTWLWQEPGGCHAAGLFHFQIETALSAAHLRDLFNLEMELDDGLLFEAGVNVCV